MYLQNNCIYNYKYNYNFKIKLTKQNNGLIRYHNAKHVVREINNIEPAQYSTSEPIPTDVVKTVVTTVSHDNMKKLLKEIQGDLSIDECFTPELPDATKKYNFRDNDNQLLLAIKKIQEKYIKNCDADEY